MLSWRAYSQAPVAGPCSSFDALFSGASSRVLRNARLADVPPILSSASAQIWKLRISLSGRLESSGPEAEFGQKRSFALLGFKMPSYTESGGVTPSQKPMP